VLDGCGLLTPTPPASDLPASDLLAPHPVKENP
jgi:hypothetical protein